MALKTRVLKVTISLPGGDVILNQEINLKIRIKKASLALQNKATIDAIGLSQTLRAQLLSQFTAWQRRQTESGNPSTQNMQWVSVVIEAGYAQGANLQTSVVYKGQVVQVDPIAGPPGIGVRISCFTRQVDKTTFISTSAPAQSTFKAFVQWAAGEMGFGNNFSCDTSYDNVIVTNPARSIHTHAALLIKMQDIYMPDVAAFVDDDFLYVKDRNKVVNTSNIANITTFIGAPAWTEWGVQFTTLFDQSIRLAQASSLTSLMNPSLNGTYIVMDIEYDLCSRDTPFYVTASANPPA